MKITSNLNIPMYRAKKINSDKYVQGFLMPPNPDFEDGIMSWEQTPMCPYSGYTDVCMKTNKIDPTTLSINFPSWKDRHNKPIFASLREDGKGGDMVKTKGMPATTPFYKNGVFRLETLFGFCEFGAIAEDVKIIGIKE